LISLVRVLYLFAFSFRSPPSVLRQQNKETFSLVAENGFFPQECCFPLILFLWPSPRPFSLKLPSSVSAFISRIFERKFGITPPFTTCFYFSFFFWVFFKPFCPKCFVRTFFILTPLSFWVLAGHFSTNSLSCPLRFGCHVVSVPPAWLSKIGFLLFYSFWFPKSNPSRDC